LLICPDEKFLWCVSEWERDYILNIFCFSFLKRAPAHFRIENKTAVTKVSFEIFNKFLKMINFFFSFIKKNDFKIFLKLKLFVHIDLIS